MKKTVYGETEIYTRSACHECVHLKENEDGMFFCKFNPDELFDDDEDEGLPALVFSIYHGTYGNVSSSGCDCDDFDSGEDDCDYEDRHDSDYDGRYDYCPSIFDKI